MKNLSASGESPQSRLIRALINFGKPLVAAVQSAAIGGGTTMLAPCDFVHAGGREVPTPFCELGVNAPIELLLHFKGAHKIAQLRGRS
jgi:enoyl-CoA hydratase/carnithine racemase